MYGAKNISSSENFAYALNELPLDLRARNRFPMVFFKRDALENFSKHLRWGPFL